MLFRFISGYYTLRRVFVSISALYHLVSELMSVRLHELNLLERHSQFACTAMKESPKNSTDLGMFGCVHIRVLLKGVFRLDDNALFASARGHTSELS